MQEGDISADAFQNWIWIYEIIPTVEFWMVKQKICINL